MRNVNDIWNELAEKCAYGDDAHAEVDHEAEIHRDRCEAMAFALALAVMAVAREAWIKDIAAEEAGYWEALTRCYDGVDAVRSLRYRAGLI